MRRSARAHGRSDVASRFAVVVCLTSVLLGASAACSMLVDTTGLASSSGVESGSEGDGGGVGSGGDGGGGPGGDDGGGSGADGSSSAGDGQAPGSSTYRDAVLADGPLAYYRLDESTDNLAKDETGRFNGLYRRSSAAVRPR
jgi:hypothetical protein